MIDMMRIGLIKKHISQVKIDSFPISYYEKLKLTEVFAPSWMFEDTAFFINIYEDRAFAEKTFLSKIKDFS